jgi:large subunit ribosomal protein L4
MTNIVKKTAIGLIHRIYLTSLKTKKLYLASTKTKAEVRGGGRKPWRQKGTGRARAGSIRSPLWRGGGVCFGPRPHFIKTKINKKERQLAVKLLFSLKTPNLFITSTFILNKFRKIKTKFIKNLLTSLELTMDKRFLIIIPTFNKNLWLSLRNFKNIKLVLLKNLNITSLINIDKIIISSSMFILLNKLYNL